MTILGSQVDLLPLADVLEQVDAWIREPDGICHRIVVTGFHGLWEASEDPALRTMLELEPDFLVGTGDNVYYDHPARTPARTGPRTSSSD